MKQKSLLIFVFFLISCVQQPVAPVEESGVVSSGENSSIQNGKTNSLYLEAEVGTSGYFRKVNVGEAVDLGGIDVIESYGINADESTKPREAVRSIRLVNDTNEMITIRGAQSSRGVRFHGDIYYKRVYPQEKFLIPLMFDGSQERFFGETIALQVDQGGERRLLSIPISARVHDKFGTLKKIADKKNEGSTEVVTQNNAVSGETQKMLDLYKYQMEQMKLQMEIMQQKKESEQAGEAALLARLLEDQQKSQREYQQQILNLQNKLLAEERIKRAEEERRRYEEELEEKKKIAEENLANQAIQAQLAALMAQLEQAKYTETLRQKELERLAAELELQKEKEQEKFLSEVEENTNETVAGVVGGVGSSGGSSNDNNTGSVDISDPDLGDAFEAILGGTNDEVMESNGQCQKVQKRLCPEGMDKIGSIVPKLSCSNGFFGFGGQCYLGVLNSKDQLVSMKVSQVTNSTYKAGSICCSKE